MIVRPELSIIADSFIPASCRVYPFVNIYKTILADGVVVGPFVELGGCKIGERTKIGSHTFICPNVEIGTDCFISHLVGFCNDSFQDPLEYKHISEMEQQWKSKPVRVGNFVRIGTGAVILPGVTIEDHAIIGAGAVVRSNVGPREIVAGTPARLLGLTSNPWENFS